MADGCTHDCSTCNVDCESKKQDFRAYLNKNSKVRKVIGVVSGKGGVGKSFVTSYLSVLMKRLTLIFLVYLTETNGVTI